MLEVNACAQLTGQRGGTNGLGNDAKDHGDLVYNHLCPSKMVNLIEHRGTLELRPLQLPEI